MKYRNFKIKWKFLLRIFKRIKVLFCLYFLLKIKKDLMMQF